MSFELDDEEEMQKQHTKDYYDQLGLDLTELLNKKVTKLASKNKQAQLPKINIPDVEEKTPAVKPGVPGAAPVAKPAAPGAPSVVNPIPVADLTPPPIAPSPEETEEMINGLEDIKDSLQLAEVEEKINGMKYELRKEFESTIKTLKTELDDLKGRKVPAVEQYDTGGIYKEKIYDLVTRLLDGLFVDLFDDVPDYSLLAVQVSRLFNDGTLSDGIVALTATVPNSGYRYDFKIDVPVLNGIVHFPTYIQRGQKIIPLTKEKIQEEINSMAFRKVEIEEPYNKGNIFNNIGDNIYRRDDHQKWYEVDQQEIKPSGLPPKAKWHPTMDSRR